MTVPTTNTASNQPISGVTGAGTIAEGADVNAGATTDAAVTSDANGTLSAKLRGLVKMIADVWDSAAHVIKASVASLPLPTGAATSANQATELTSLANIDTNAGASTDAIVAAGAAGSVSAKLRRVTQGLADLLTGIVLAAGEAHVGSVGGQKSSVSVSFTRPADTTAYTAKDALGINLAVTGATNATPIVVTTATHSLADGDPVTIASVGGNTNANGNFFAKVTGQSSTTFALYSDKALTTPVAGNGAYTSGGTVAKVLRFVNVARLNGGSGYIVKASALLDQTTNTESFRLHLYKSPPAGILDNAPCTSPLYADAANYVGTLDFPAAKTEGTGATAAYANVTGNIANSNLPMGFSCAANDRDLYGVPETPNGFTPANAGQFTIKLLAETD